MLKKKVYQFTCYFIPDEQAGGFSVEVPVLRGCHTEGNTFEEAKTNIKEAIELYCKTLIARGLSIPADEDINFLKTKVELTCLSSLRA